MITVTEAAKQELYRILMTDGITDTTVGFRLNIQSAGEYALVPDFAKDDDQVVEHKGSKVLLVGKGLANALDGMTIDYTETDGGARLCISEV